MLKGSIIVYTQPLDAAALHIADTQGCGTLLPAEPYSVPHSIQQPYGHYHWRRLDFCEGDGGFVCVRFIWDDCKGECYTFTRKASAIDTQEG